MHATFPVEFSSWLCSVKSRTFTLNTGIFSGIRKVKWYKGSWEVFSHLAVITNKVCVVQYSCSCSCSWSYTQSYPHFPGFHLWHRHSSWLKTLSFLWRFVAMDSYLAPRHQEVPSGLQLEVPLQHLEKTTYYFSLSQPREKWICICWQSLSCLFLGMKNTNTKLTHHGKSPNTEGREAHAVWLSIETHGWLWGT